MKKTLTSKITIIFCVLFYIFGIYTIATSVCAVKENADAKRNGIAVIGYISDIISYGEDGRDDAYITYTVDGEELTRELDCYFAPLKVGDSVTVYYYPENPGKIYYQMIDVLIITGFPAIVFILIGTILAVSVYKAKSK